MPIPEFVLALRSHVGSELLWLPGVSAVVVHDDGRLLLGRRADNGLWAIVSGILEPGEQPALAAVREVLEETGIEVEVERLIAVLDGLRLGFTRVPLYSLIFHCRAVGGALERHPLECADVGWFGSDELPEPLAGYSLWGERAFAAIRGEALDVMFDRPRTPPWRS